MHGTFLSAQWKTGIILSAVVFVVLCILSACSRQPRYAAPPVEGGEIVLETASLPLEVPRYFTVVHDGRYISFFVVRLAAGVQSYFDACVTCYARKQGYAFREEQVVCRACDTRYSIYQLDTGIGGCYPIRLPGRSEAGRYRIPLAQVRAEAGRF